MIPSNKYVFCKNKIITILSNFVWIGHMYLWAQYVSCQTFNYFCINTWNLVHTIYLRFHLFCSSLTCLQIHVSYYITSTFFFTNFHLKTSYYYHRHGNPFKSIFSRLPDIWLTSLRLHQFYRFLVKIERGERKPQKCWDVLVACPDAEESS